MLLNLTHWAFRNYRDRSARQHWIDSGKWREQNSYRQNDFSSYGDAFHLPRAAATVFHSNHFRTSITSVVSQLIESGNFNKHSINGKWPALNWHFSRQLESIYSRHTFRQRCWWIPWVGFHRRQGRGSNQGLSNR